MSSHIGAHAEDRGRSVPRTAVAFLLAFIVSLALAMAGTQPSDAATPEPGDSVYVGDVYEPDGSSLLFPVYLTPPADPDNPGEPDFWAYCIEHDVSAQSERGAVVGNLNSFLGENYFTSAAVQGKVLWVLAHSYPAVSLADFRTAANIPGLTRDDIINATTTAIWRYTELTFDAPWAWVSPEAEAAYWYLVNGANASSGMTPGDFATTVTVTPPSGAQTSGTLVGPFTVNTNQASASVTVAPGFDLVDAAGNPINAAAVTDGQQIYLDLRTATSAGNATITATAKGSSGNGMVVSVPKTVGGTPTADNHAQSIIMVAAGKGTTTAEASTQWTAQATTEPSIGTTLVDAADGDKYILQSGGKVTDTVAYKNLEADTEYTLTGELWDKTTGKATGIVATTKFTSSGTGDGTAKVTFEIPASYAGRTLTAFEVLTIGETKVASHEDIDDVAQTVYVADLGTTLVDKADGDSQIAAEGGTVVDTVEYTNLIPETEYTVSGELIDKETGESTGIVGSKTFTTTASGNGTVEVEFTITAKWAGHTLVAFETVTRDDADIAIHQDINDEAQTVVVDEDEDEATSPSDNGSESESESDGALPDTGLGSATLPLAAGGMLILALGTGIVMWGRRRNGVQLH
ncbi:VaFE repeat-containing surface-anchored protein [Aeromicrobium sp. P5_D10]